MRIRTLELVTAVGLTIAAIFLLAKGANASDIMVMDAVASKSLTPTARTGAIVMSVMNHGNGPDRLLAMSSPAAEVAELHQNIREDGVVKMRPVTDWTLGPGETIDMLKADIHVMLVGLKAPLKPGEQVELVLTFEKAGEVRVMVPVSDKVALTGSHDHSN
jgi:periplasmic copper chaperone A